MKIAIQGIEGCYHHIAAQNYFGNEISVMPCLSFHELVETVGFNMNCTSGVMAIENSIAGSLLTNYHLLMQSGLQIAGEVALRIEHHLLSLEGQNIEDLKEVHSHPMAIKQCREFLDSLEGIKIVETEDTALSAKEVATRNRKGVAAIAGEICIPLYGLKALASNIETNSQNYTRFLILKKKENLNGAVDLNKASIYFRVDDSPGCLAKVLNMLGEKKINISKLQSYPIVGEKWQYYFFADLIFQEGADIKQDIEDLRKTAQSVTTLGIYKNKM